jgi:hypothetical protein
VGCLHAGWVALLRLHANQLARGPCSLVVYVVKWGVSWRLTGQQLGGKGVVRVMTHHRGCRVRGV